MKKYEYIYNEILKEIHNNKINIGENIPSENELSKKYNISRVTVRKAVDLLETNGFIQKSQGKESILISNEGYKKTVLLILPNIFRYIFTDIIKNIEEVLRQNNIGLFIACSYNDRQIEQQILQYHSRNIEGIIIEPTQTNYLKKEEELSPIYNVLQEIPTICINSTIPQFNLTSLTLDDKNSAKLLTEKLLDQGKKKFLIVFKTDDAQGSKRLEGVNEALLNKNIEKKVIEFSTFNENSIIDTILPIYKSYNPDCVMFYNDEFASEFLFKQEVDFKNITITGFDNSSFSSGEPFKFLSPSHPQGKMGYDAALKLVSLIKGNKEESIVYPTIIEEK